jgi:hypothetical protein
VIRICPSRTKNKGADAVVVKLRRLWKEKAVWGLKGEIMELGLGLEYFMGGRLGLLAPSQAGYGAWGPVERLL